MKTTRTLRFLSLLALTCSTLIGVSLASADSTNKSVKSETASFWTAKRISEAIAFEMVFENGSKVAKRVPVTKAAGKPGGGGGGSSVLGSPWLFGGDPLTASGKVFFTFNGSAFYQCSGSLVDDESADYSIVLTAGHCLFEHADGNGDGIGDGFYAQRWIFVPSYFLDQVLISGCEDSPNCWTASSLKAHPSYRNQTDFTSIATHFDWGFAKITEKKNNKLPDELGDGSNSFPINFSTTLSRKSVASAFGYPADGKYNGRDLVFSRGSVSYDSWNSNKTYALASDMTGGSSGGPWLSDMGSAPSYSGTLRSVNSYKYGTTNFMYGPKFSSATQATFNEAKSAITNP